MPILCSNAGYCPICEQNAEFVVTGEWLRDCYLCSRCGTAPRQRALVEILQLVEPQWRNKAIHESSPTLRFFEENCPKYTKSYYFEGVPLGSMKDEQRCESLEHLT